MQAKNKTPKRFIRDKNGVCYILNSIHVQKMSNWRGDRTNTAETLNRLSKEYNDLVAARKQLKDSYDEVSRQCHKSMEENRILADKCKELESRGHIFVLTEEDKINYKSKVRIHLDYDVYLKLENKKTHLLIWSWSASAIAIICLIAYLIK